MNRKSNHQNLLRTAVMPAAGIKLIMALLMLLTAATAWADSETIVTAETTEMTNGTYRVSDDITIETRITINGTVTLILDEGKTLNAMMGIGVTDDNALTIDGMGTLNAKGGSFAAGIGAFFYKDSGSITINGGTVIATGGSEGAGIGGGFFGTMGGTITINGGTVTATGGSEGAGIGGGYGCKMRGTIIISGGSVTANGGRLSAGIGGGGSDIVENDAVGGTGGTIIISGGSVSATGGFHGAGIGGGGASQGGEGGNITISGGVVTATGGEQAAGIGGGGGKGYTSPGGASGTIKINGGTVTATGGMSSAGIGGANQGACEEITISGGKVTANGDDDASDIGPGFDINSVVSGTVTLGWTNEDDFIDAGNYDGVASIVLKNKFYFIEDGIALLATIDNIAGKKLLPVNYNLNIVNFIGIKPRCHYTGNVIDIAYEVYNIEGEKLVKGIDYTEAVSPLPVKDLGEYTLTITPANGSKYKGSKSIDFSVVVFDMEEAEVSGLKPYYLYTGKKYNIAYTVTIEGSELTEGVDYIAYFDKTPIQESGDYTLTLNALGVGYKGSKSISFTVGDGIPVTSETIVMDGVHKVTEDVTIYTRIKINGDVTLNLDEGKTLNATNGIELSKGNKLTIIGKGTLNAITYYFDYSGIGSKEVGTLVIEDGFINAQGGGMSAGIGGSCPNSSGGTIIINGGTVNATGGSIGGAGIGGSYVNCIDPIGMCGTVIINGGKVTAIGGSKSPGIGAQNCAPTSGSITLGWTNEDDYIYASSYGNVSSIKFVDGKHFYWTKDGIKQMALVGNIDGNTIVPLDEENINNFEYLYVSGIEPYYLYTGKDIDFAYEVIDIDGNKLEKGTHFKESFSRTPIKDKGNYTLTLTAIDDKGYTGYKTISFTVGDGFPVTVGTTELTDHFCRVSNDVTIDERINIKGDVILIIDEGTTLTASKGIELSNGNQLTIEGKGTLIAKGADSYSGIGAKEVGTLVINDGIIKATGGNNGAGIGGNTHNSSGGTIVINDGDVTAISGWDGAGIGGGFFGVCGTITINGGKVLAHSRADDVPGIGPGFAGSATGSVTLNWTNRNDQIFASSYGCNVAIANGKMFFNGSEYISGSISDMGKIDYLTLIPAMEQTITADCDTKTYDGIPLTKGTYTHTTLYEGDYIESVTITGSQTNVGSCDNVPSGAVIKDAANRNVTTFYCITCVNGTLEVLPKDVTVKADDKKKFINNADPTLTTTVTGIIEGENESLISYDIGREAGESVGTYTITPTGETTQGNYAVTYETGTLTITDEMNINITSPTAPTVLELDEDYTSENVLSVTLAATVDGQTNTYQWYENTTDDTMGGTAIDGATSSSYTLPWGIEGLLPGTYYFYCVVTASRTEITTTVTATSPLMTVKVTAIDHEPGHYKNPFVISTPAELNQLAQEVNNGNTYEDKYIKLGNDIAYDPDVLDIDNDGNGVNESNYTAIGMYVKDGDLDIQRPFNGHFDGAGHTISGIRLNHNSGENTYYNSYKGLFGYLGSDASISNVTLTDTEITANYYVGGIAGYAWNSSITNCHVTSSVTIHAVMDNAGSHGGIVGENYGTVSHCTSAVNLTIANGKTPGWDYGGIVGCHHKDGVITDNLVLGATVPAARYCSNGAITGNNEGTLSRNYYSGCTVAGETTNVGSAHWLPNITNYEVADVTDNDGAVPVPSATISKEGYGTYYISAADVVLSAGMKALIVTANEGGGSLTYQTIADGSSSTKTVPAGTAVMLQTDPSTDKQTISMTLAAQTDQRDFSASNLLHGSDVAKTTDGGGAGAKFFKLSYNTSGKKVGWYWGADDGSAFTSAAHKAWLVLPASAGARFFALPRGDETTSMEDGRRKMEDGKNDWYSLEGRKLSGRPTRKGVYIHNGRKEVIK